MDYKAIKESNNEAVTIEKPTLEGKHKETNDFVSRRVREMQDYRKSLKIEDKWREADSEYEPSDLDGAEKRMHFEADEETGLRSRLVPIGDGTKEWRSRNSDPTLLTKIQTAISIIIDQNPEALLSPAGKKYEKATAVAYAAWKRNWNITNAKEVYKLFAFNCAKYGWAVGRSYPRLVKYDKEVLVEKGSTPDEDVYEKAENVWFNDVAKESLDPFRTWIDEQTKPYDDYSMNDCYYEKDYSYDAAKVEFGDYADFDKYIKPNADLRMTYNDGDTLADKEDDKKTRKDIITIGFYENRLKDLYAIRIPKLDVCLFYSPLPNDDGMLSIWQTPWLLRSATNPYGISIWETIRQKKELYDKMQNMTMDQLVLSIMKMFFYTGTSTLLGDGQIEIEPGKGHQIVNGKVDWMEIPGPGKDAWEGMRHLKAGMDDDSGVTPTLGGELSDKNTLGEILHAKEGALKRLKIPVENIADAMEQDAYITISWMAQIYSTPEVKEFLDLEEVQKYEQETGLQRNQLFGGVSEETGEPEGPFKATYLPEVSLPLEKDGATLKESKKERFFQIGRDIPVGNLYWKGMFKVIPKSILSPSAELDKQRGMEVFNILVPLLANPPELFAKPAQQLLKRNEEDPKDWLPDSWIQFLDQDGPGLMMPPPQPQVDPETGQPIDIGASNQSSMQGAAGTTPGASAPTVVPQSQFSSPQSPGFNAAPRTEMTRMG